VRGREQYTVTTALGGRDHARRLALVAFLVASAGCASARPQHAKAAPGDRGVLPGAAADALPGAAERFGYRAERERLLALLEDAREPGEQARLVMELADLAERTRGAALARRTELEPYRDDAARAEREELGQAAQSLLDEELKLLDSIARDYPTSPRRDEALYRLGFNLLDRDSPDAALQYARTLFATYPASPYVAHAYLAFADHDYEEGSRDQAIKLYEKVIAFANPEATPRAHLQLGRCWFAAGEHAKALEAFAAAAAAAQALGGQGGEALRDEALAELVQAYARAGAPEAAPAFFERVGGDRIDDLLERLGAAYFDDGRFRESIAINRQVADRVECSPVMARAEVAVFEARLYLGEIADLKAEGEALVAVFARLSQCLPAERLVEFAEAGAAAKAAIETQAARYRREYEMSGAPAAAQMADDLEVMAEKF
jgi:tetratricopeptide (TPR) repeat protein